LGFGVRRESESAACSSDAAARRRSSDEQNPNVKAPEKKLTRQEKKQRAKGAGPLLEYLNGMAVYRAGIINRRRGVGRRRPDGTPAVGGSAPSQCMCVAAAVKDSLPNRPFAERAYSLGAQLVFGEEPFLVFAPSLTPRRPSPD